MKEHTSVSIPLNRNISITEGNKISVARGFDINLMRDGSGGISKQESFQS